MFYGTIIDFQKVVCHIQGFSLKVLMGRTLAAVPCVLRASGCSPVRPLRSWYTYFQLKMNICREHHPWLHWLVFGWFWLYQVLFCLLAGCASLRWSRQKGREVQVMDVNQSNKQTINQTSNQSIKQTDNQSSKQSVTQRNKQSNTSKGPKKKPYMKIMQLPIDRPRRLLC